jgi:ribosomal protein S18 acetylase RimI-like enzyme
MAIEGLTWRTEPGPSDADAIRAIVESTGYFHDYEVDVAVELVEERLAKGIASGYYFVFAEKDGRVIGYSCYGPIACTTGSYDLFWIAVHDDFRGKGIGKLLMERTEKAVAAEGGRSVYVETSSKEQYISTRAFYEKFGYVKEAQIRDFYEEGDDKVIYSRRVKL